LWLAAQVPLFSNAILVQPGVTCGSSRRGFVYRLFKAYLPANVSAPLESFGFQPGGYYGMADDAHRLVGPLDGSLAGFAGLIVGLPIVYFGIPR